MTLLQSLLAVVLILLATAVVAVARLVRRNRELVGLEQVANATSSALTEAELLTVLARETPRVIEWDRIAVGLLDDEAESVRLVFLDREGSLLGERLLARGAGLTGTAISSCAPVLWTADGQVAPLDGEAEGAHPAAILTVPMLLRGAPVGTIAFHRSRGRFDAWSARAAGAIASHAAIAISNARLIEKERMARAERDEFFAIVTHEIRTPLASIAGFAELAERDLAGARASEAAESVRVVRRETDRILAIAADVLDAERLDAGRLALEPRPVDLPLLAGERVDRQRRSSGREIELDCAGTIPVIQADQLRVGQVLDNLIANAIAYASGATPIRVTIEAIGETVEIAVENDGVTLEGEQASGLFERFRRGSEAGRRGAGLGLYVSRGIVRMHGGELRAEPRHGGGMRFVATLPCRREG